MVTHVDFLHPIWQCWIRTVHWGVHCQPSPQEESLIHRSRFTTQWNRKCLEVLVCGQNLQSAGRVLSFLLWGQVSVLIRLIYSFYSDSLHSSSAPGSGVTEIFHFPPILSLSSPFSNSASHTCTFRICLCPSDGNKTLPSSFLVLFFPFPLALPGFHLSIPLLLSFVERWCCAFVVCKSAGSLTVKGGVKPVPWLHKNHIPLRWAGVGWGRKLGEEIQTRRPAFSVRLNWSSACGLPAVPLATRSRWAVTVRAQAAEPSSSQPYSALWASTVATGL